MLSRLLLLTAAAVLTLACPRLPPSTSVDEPHPEALRSEVSALSASAQKLLKAQDELVWKGWTQGGAIDIERTYEGQQSLFTPTSLATIRRLLAISRDETQRRALMHLEAHFAGEYLTQQLTEVSNAIANLEASARVEVAGKEHAYRELPRLWANEKSQEQRRALYAAATPTVERLTASTRRKEQRISELLTQLGYPSYGAFAATLRETDLNALRALAEQVLSSSEEAYLRVIGELAQRELQLPRSALTRADFARLFRPKGVDTFFPKDALTGSLRKTVAGMGIQLDALKNLTLDAREDAKKNPRTLAIAVEVPDDVRLSLRPLGGLDDYASAFHELAHALHYAHAERLTFELGKLGNATVTEAYGFLFEDLVADPTWIQQNTTLPAERLPGYLSASSAFALHQLRMAAGAVLYGVLVHERDESEARALYAQVMSRVLGIKLTAEESARYSVDREDFLDSADALRSRCLAGQLQAQLKLRFGPTWWRQPAAGELLRSLWKHGNAKSADEIAILAGESGVRADALLARLTSALR